jgi:hypothetical protein
MQSNALAVVENLCNRLVEFTGNMRHFRELTAAGPVAADQQAVLGRRVHHQYAAILAESDDARVELIQ